MNKTIKMILKCSYFIIALVVYIYFVPLIHSMDESQSIGWTGNRVPYLQYILFIGYFLFILIISNAVYYIYVLIKNIRKNI